MPGEPGTQPPADPALMEAAQEPSPSRHLGHTPLLLSGLVIFQSRIFPLGAGRTSRHQQLNQKGLYPGRSQRQVRERVVTQQLEGSGQGGAAGARRSKGVLSGRAVPQLSGCVHLCPYTSSDTCSTRRGQRLLGARTQALAEAGERGLTPAPM